MIYAIVRHGLPIFETNSRDSVMRLSTSRTLHGTPCRWVAGGWPHLDTDHLPRA